MVLTFSFSLSSDQGNFLSHRSCDQLTTSRDYFPMPLPKTEIPGHLQACLMERAIRLTSQRRAILQIIEMATKHFDASQIRKVQRPNASVGRGAVYRRFTSVEAPSLDRRS